MQAAADIFALTMLEKQYIMVKGQFSDKLAKMQKRFNMVKRI